MKKKCLLIILTIGIVAISNSIIGQNKYQYALSDLKEKLPSPILDDHPGWIELYWKTWDLASKKVKMGTPENGFVPYYMDEGFKEDIFQWDTFFMMVFEMYGYHIFPTICSLDNFYLKQYPDGYICRQIHESDGSDRYKNREAASVNPPVFSWIEWKYYELSGDKERFSRILPILIKYFDWVKKNRMSTTEGLYWNNGRGSGMDNSPRGPEKEEAPNMCWIDMSAQQAMNAFYIAKIAEVIEKKSIAKKFEAEYNSLKKLINKKMWSAEDGFYYDLDNGEFNKVKTLATYWTMLAKIPDLKKSKMLVKHLTNPMEFWRLHCFPTLSADHPQYVDRGGYWKGGVWAPTNYITIKGLETNGFDDLAKRAAENHIENMYKVYLSEKTIFENYAPEICIPGEKVIKDTIDSKGEKVKIYQRNAKRDFVGWSGCGPVAMLIEHVIGIRANGAEDQLEWYLSQKGKNGIENLRFGDNIVSLVAESRLTHAHSARISIVSNNNFTLTVKLNGKVFTKKIKPGNTIWEVKV